MIGSQQLQKRINLCQVMRTVRRIGPVSRAEVARRTSLTKSTVTNLVRDLMADDLLTETGGPTVRAQGRPPVLLELSTKPAIIGVELRPDTVRIVRVSLTGEVIATVDQALDASQGRLSIAWSRAAELLDDFVTRDCVGIGIAVPAIVDPVEGRIIQSEEFGETVGDITWAKRPDLPLVVENDANAVAWATVNDLGAGNDAVLNALVVMGRKRPHETLRVGTGLVIDGRVYYGRSFDAGEFRSYRWRREHPGELKSDRLDQRGGDEALVELLESLAVAVSIVRPDHVVFAGELVDYIDRIEGLAQRDLAGSAIDPRVSGAPLLTAKGGRWAVARGAAHMMLEHLYATPLADRMRPASAPYWDTLRPV